MPEAGWFDSRANKWREMLFTGENLPFSAGLTHVNSMR
jgi:hypothetical protein